MLLCNFHSIQCRRLTFSSLIRRGNGRDRPANNIYGMMEAGFTSNNPNWGCLGDRVIEGGFDTKTAEHIGQVLCPDETISVLDFCGGHAFPYHYHERMSCLFSDLAEGPTKGHSTRVGTALDGNGIYGHHVRLDQRFGFLSYICSLFCFPNSVASPLFLRYIDHWRLCPYRSRCMWGKSGDHPRL